MKAMTLKLIFALVLLTTANAQADIEVVSVLAANIESVSNAMDLNNDRLVDQVSTDFSKELIDDLDSRLLLEFDQLTSSAE